MRSRWKPAERSTSNHATRPCTSTEPCVGGSTPATTCSRVVLPEPLLPMMPRTCRSGTSRSRAAERPVLAAPPAEPEAVPGPVGLGEAAAIRDRRLGPPWVGGALGLDLGPEHRRRPLGADPRADLGRGHRSGALGQPPQHPAAVAEVQLDDQQRGQGQVVGRRSVAAMAVARASTAPPELDASVGRAVGADQRVARTGLEPEVNVFRTISTLKRLCRPMVSSADVIGATADRTDPARRRARTSPAAPASGRSRNTRTPAQVSPTCLARSFRRSRRQTPDAALYALTKGLIGRPYSRGGITMRRHHTKVRRHPCAAFLCPW